LPLPVALWILGLHLFPFGLHGLGCAHSCFPRIPTHMPGSDTLPHTFPVLVAPHCLQVPLDFGFGWFAVGYVAVGSFVTVGYTHTVHTHFAPLHLRHTCPLARLHTHTPGWVGLQVGHTHTQFPHTTVTPHTHVGYLTHTLVLGFFTLVYGWVYHFWTFVGLHLGPTLPGFGWFLCGLFPQVGYTPCPGWTPLWITLDCLGLDLIAFGFGFAVGCLVMVGLFAYSPGLPLPGYTHTLPTHLGWTFTLCLARLPQFALYTPLDSWLGRLDPSWLDLPHACYSCLWCPDCVGCPLPVDLRLDYALRSTLDLLGVGLVVTFPCLDCRWLVPLVTRWLDLR